MVLFLFRDSGSLSLSSSSLFFLFPPFGAVADVGVALFEPPAWLNDVDSGVGAAGVEPAEPGVAMPCKKKHVSLVTPAVEVARAYSHR